MLLNAYRAIFKSAYFKGMASTVILTAGLAAGAANAETAFDLSSGAFTTVSAVYDDGQSTTQNVSGHQWVNNIQVTNGSTAIFSGGTTSGDVVSVSKGVSISGEGSKLTLSGVVLNGLDSEVIWDAVSDDSVLSISDKGTLEVKNSIAYFRTADVLNNAVITVGGNNATSGSSDVISDNSWLFFKNAMNGDHKTITVNGADTKITLEDQSFLGIACYSVFNDGTIDFQGTSGDQNAAILQVAKRYETQFNGVDVNVADNKAGTLAAGVLTISAGKISNAGNLYIVGAAAKPETTYVSGGALQSAVTMTGGEIVNSGTLQIGTDNKDTFTVTGGSMTNTGTVVVNSNLTVNTLDGWFNNTSGSGAASLNFSGSTLTITGNSADLTAANFNGNANAVLIAEDATVTLNNDYDKDFKDVTVGTLNAISTTGYLGSGYETRSFFAIENGTVTALNGIDADKDGSELLIYGRENSSTAKLVLGNADTAHGQLTDITRVHVGWGSAGSGSSALEVYGNWDFGDARLSVAKSGSATINGAVSNVDSIQMQQDGNLIINAGASLTAQRLLGNESGASGAIIVNGTLAITGDNNPDQASASGYYNDFYLGTSSLEINAGGTLDVTSADVREDILTINTSGDTVTSIIVNTSGSSANDNGVWASGSVTLAAGGKILFDLSDYTVSSTILSGLTKNLVGSNASGSVSYGNVNLSDYSSFIDESATTAAGSDVIDVDAVASGGLANTEIAAFADKKGTVSSGGAADLGGSYGAIEADVGTTEIKATGDLTLSNAASNNDNFASVSGSNSPADIDVGENAALTLNGAGNAGQIGSSNASGAAVLNAQTGVQNIKGLSVKDAQVQSGTVNATSVDVGKLTVSAGSLLNVQSGEVAANVSVGADGADIAGTLNAGTVTSSGDVSVGGSLNATNVTVSGAVTVDGVLTAVETVAVSGDVAVTGALTADTLTLTDAAQSVSVGSSDSTGSIAVRAMNLNGGMLLIDPDWDEDASFVTVEEDFTPESDVVNVNGSVGIGRNSVGVFGAEEAEARDALSRLGLLTDNKLSSGGTGAVMYLGETYSVAEGKHVLLNKNLDNDGLSGAIADYSGSGSVTLTNGSALVISEEMTEDLVYSENNKPIFYFATSGNTSVTAEGGSSIIFDSTNVIGGMEVTVAGSSGGTTSVDLSRADITAANGLLTANPASGDTTIKFQLADNAETKLYNQSNPVKAMTIRVMDNADGDYNVDDSLGVAYIAAMNANKGGQAIEETARLAVYAGAVQATYMAQQSSTDAVADRLGIANPNSNLVYADNLNGGGIWLAPIYKNHDSDEFDAQGVDYGADIDLYGVALGADFTTDSGVRVGAYFNVGSGDADGQGVGSDVSNDFDYFGLGLYAGKTFGNFNFIADAGFTQVSNDIDQSVNYHGVGKITADTDTTAVTVGLRGEYKFETQFVDITPHLGVRYTNLDMDSYDAKLDGQVVATTDADNMQIFSIPFGVSFAKEFTAGEWSVKPVFDLTLTANAGDTDFDTDTTFIGVEGLSLSTEVLDDFTYGGTLGVSAEYGDSLGFGINVHYVGSDAADEFGVTGNIRYMF